MIFSFGVDMDTADIRETANGDIRTAKNRIRVPLSAESEIPCGFAWQKKDKPYSDLFFSEHTKHKNQPSKDAFSRRGLILLCVEKFYIFFTSFSGTKDGSRW